MKFQFLLKLYTLLANVAWTCTFFCLEYILALDYKSENIYCLEFYKG